MTVDCSRDRSNWMNSWRSGSPRLTWVGVSVADRDLVFHGPSARFGIRRKRRLRTLRTASFLNSLSSRMRLVSAGSERFGVPPSKTRDGAGGHVFQLLASVF